MTRPKRILERSRATLAAFLATEASGGVVLLIAVAAAMVWANTSGSYETFWHEPRHWINDGLMTLFFFVVGLEIKRELVVGELRDRRVASLPLVAAIGGMVLPAVIYLALNAGGAGMRGWAIPMATDIAFVVGALSLLGDRVPDGLKVFLLALAIIDDVGAVFVIAVAYSTGVDIEWLAVAGATIALIVVLRRTAFPPLLAYAIGGTVLWVCALRAGIHPTLAGVALGLLCDRTLLESLEARLHPMSSYVVVPLFGLANAGVVITGGALGDAIRSPIVGGIVAGLVAGKTIGVLAATRFGQATGVGRRASGVSWRHVAGGSALSGIGFTISLLIADLAFTDAAVVDLAKIGVLIGSVASATIGIAILRGARNA